MQTHPGTVYRFGPFEVNAASAELLKNGRRVRLQEQPYRLLLVLLENSGGVVSREELRSRLWPDDTFDMRVYVGDLRTRTMNLLVYAYRFDNGDDVFFGRVTSIFVKREDRRAAIGIPDDIRRRLDEYRSANPTPPAVANALREPN